MTKKIYFLKFIPLILMVLCFHEKSYPQKYSIDDQKQMSSPKKKFRKTKEDRIIDKTIKKDNKKKIKQEKKYKKLVKKYNKKINGGGKDVFSSKKTYKRMKKSQKEAEKNRKNLKKR